MKDINLVPEYILEQRKHNENNQRISIWTAVLLLVALAVVSISFVQKFFLDSEIVTIQKQINEWQDSKKDNDLIFMLQSDIKQKEAILKEIDSGNAIALSFIRKFEKQIPSGVGSVTINYSSIDGSANITAKASNPYAIADLIHNLKEDGAFSEVFVPMFPMNGTGTFTISFKYIDRK